VHSLVAVSDVAVSAQSEMVRASALVGAPVDDGHGGPVGRVEDLVARLADDGYPPVTGVLARAGEREVFVPVGRMAAMGSGGVMLLPGGAELSEFERRPGEVLLMRDVVGRQLVFIDEHHRGRLVRASDIELALRGGTWVVVGIDAGPRSRWPWRRRSGSARIVDWAHVEPFLSHVPTSRLGLRLRWLVQLHPGDVADLVEEASPDEAEEIIRAVSEDRDFEADVFEELDQEHQLELVGKRSDQQVADLLGKMAPDDAADLLGEIDRARREPILALMPPAGGQRLRNLLSYNPQSAGGMMSPGGICVPSTTSVSDALERIREDRELPETFDSVLVVDEEGRLAAAARLLELLRAEPTAAMGTVAHPDPPRVRTGADLVEVTLIMTDYNLTTLAVVDDDDRVVGVVTIDDVVEQLVPENWRRRAEAED
jgi:CBS domain-containing protein